MVANDWTQDEVTSVVADYFAMLRAELQGDSYNKSAHRRAVLPRLEDRSDGSVERKHQNTSAVLINLGLPYITGYKPLGNYQGLLAEEVERYVKAHPEFIEVVRADVERAAELPNLQDYLSALVDAPNVEDFSPGVILDAPNGHRPRTGGRTNYLEREMSNSSLGLAGEEFVLKYERERLLSVDDGALADRVEHVSQTQGDGLGFDVRSFDNAGRDLFIEVKTTRYGALTPFYVSSNELAFSRDRWSSYELYRVFQFRADPKLFVLPGAIDERCALHPHTYRAWPA